MAGVQAAKEAMLREVLAEVSVVDVGRKLKSLGAYLGCYLVLIIVVLLVTTISSSAGFDFDALGMPTWLIWLLVGWMYVHGLTSQRSYHELNGSWYFPKLNWLGSLILTAYLLGFVYLAVWVTDMEVGFERAVAFVLVTVGYVFPFVLFLSVISVGYAKLIEKRTEAARRTADTRPALRVTD